MPGLEAARRPICWLPARRPAAGGIIRRSRIQTQAGDDRKRVAVARINGDPFSWSAAPVDSKFFRVHRDAYKAGAGQGIGNRAGTIVGGVVKGFVTTAKSIRLGPQLVGRPDRALDRHRRVHWRERQLAIQLAPGFRESWVPDKGKELAKLACAASPRTAAHIRDFRIEILTRSSKSAVGVPARFLQKIAAPGKHNFVATSQRGGVWRGTPGAGAANNTARPSVN